MDYCYWNWRANIEEKNSFSKLFSGTWKITQKGKMVNWESDFFSPREDEQEYALIPGDAAGPWFLAANWAERKETMWLYRTSVNFHLIWYPALHHSSWKPMPGEIIETGQIKSVLSWETFSRQWAGTFQAGTAKKIIVLNSYSYHLYNPCLKTSVSSAPLCCTAASHPI